MQSIKNNVQLIGHLGKNPEVITLENGTKVAKLLLATNEYRKNAQGEKQTHTSWHHLTAWGVQASIAEKFLIKGKQIVVNGRLSQKPYTTKDGSKRIFTEIIVSNLQTIA
jgi:single-strand DNA-binding protein